MIRRARLHPNRARLIAGWRSRPKKSPRGWKRRFDDSIPLPRGRQLVTLKDGERRSQRPDLPRGDNRCERYDLNKSKRKENLGHIMLASEREQVWASQTSSCPPWG